MSHHKVAKTEKPQEPTEGADADGQDTEGHNMWISGSGRELSRGRNADIERQVRERQREKDAKKKR